MTTYNEQLQNLWHRYERANGGIPAAPREVVEWALRKGLLEAPRFDPRDALAEEMARALREEYKTDANGRRYRVNHAIRITKGGVQMSLWASLDSAPRDHMVKAFAQRRRQIVGDCIQLQTDVDVYNERHENAEPIQMVLDFTEDVAEAKVLMDHRAA